MKKYLFLLLIGLAYTATAQDLKLKITNTTNYSRPKYAAKSETNNDNEKAKLILGYSVNVEAELPLTGIVSFYGGIGYKQKRFKPQVGRFNNNINFLLPISSPQLGSNYNPEKHQIHLLSIPVGVKLKSQKVKKISPYFTIGLVSDIIFSESETYSDLYSSAYEYIDINIPYFGGYGEEQTYIENNFDYYGTAMNIGFGLDLAISDIYMISIYSDFNAVEFRKENYRMNNDALTLWDNSFHMFGEISLGLGVQCRL